MVRDKPEAATYKSRLSPNVDVRGFYPKYEIHPWTTEFALENIRLSKTGLKDFKKSSEIIKSGYQDVAAVYFPGISPAITNGEASIDEYAVVRAAKYDNTNRPFSPRIIPTLPQSSS